MKRNLLLVAVSMLAMLSLTFCTSTQTTEGGGGDSGGGSTGRGMVIDAANQLLASVTYWPNGKGYIYKSTALPADDFKKWTGVNKAKIDEALTKVADGFALQVVGHTCSIGPRDAQPGKKGNVWYSTERAKGVYDYLVKQLKYSA